MQPLLECPFGFMLVPIWIYVGPHLDFCIGPHLDFIGLHLDFWDARLGVLCVPASIMVPR